jgi:hypothetical protein
MHGIRSAILQGRLATYTASVRAAWGAHEHIEGAAEN